jgi:hypothetical protein
MMHNLFASLFPGVAGMTFTTILDWMGWLLMGGFIVVVMLIEKSHLRTYLKPEVALGTLTETEYQQSTSVIQINANRLKALFNGKYTVTTRFYRTAAELAIKNRQLEKFGEERGNAQAVTNLRLQLRDLSNAL